MPRIAVIGHTGRGNYGHGVDTCWLKNSACEIVGVADPDEKGRAAAAKRLKTDQAFGDYRELLDKTKPDIVAVCPRFIDRHGEYILAAAERGLHVFTEKPFCRTPAEADQIIAAFEKKKLKLAIAHQTRYSPIVREIRELIEDGRIGDVLELRGRGKEDHRGGPEDLWVLGSHVFNLMHHLGGEPTWCSAAIRQGDAAATKADIRPGNEGVDRFLGDDLVATFGLAGRGTGFFGSRKGAAGGRFGLQIFGSKGVIDVEFGYLPNAFLLEDPNWSPGRSGKEWQRITSAGVGKPEPLAEGGLDAGNDAIVTDLLEAIAEDREPECDMYEARTTIEMISAVFASHLAGKAVKIPLENRGDPLA